ncbi:MAG: histidine kinase [Myxococcota bacterium]
MTKAYDIHLSRRTIAAILVFWTLVGLVYMMSFYLDSIRFGTRFELSIRMTTLFTTVYMSWAGITVALYWVLRKPIIEGHALHTAIIFVLGTLIWQPLVALLDTTVTSLIFEGTLTSVLDNFTKIRSTTLFFHLILYVVVFATCAGLIYQQYSENTRFAALDLERKNAQAELDVTRLHLRSLQAQLSPHFLFNSLNSISGLARRYDGDDIVTAVARLGELLRFALSASEKSLVSLQDEIDFTESYVSLQHLRFGDAYTFKLEYSQDLGALPCPPFVLQALVENAFTHQVDQGHRQIEIRAQIHRQDDTLWVVVSNSIDGSLSSNGNGLGLALTNLRHRLSILYGPRATATTAVQDDHFVARVAIPTTAESDIEA